MENLLKKWSKTVKCIKLNSWWNYKIGNALFTYLLFQSLFTTKYVVTTQDWVLILVFLFLILLGFSINDYTDYEQDKITGKNNLFNYVPLKLAPFYFITFGFISLCLSIFFLRIEITVLLFVLVILNIVYSSKPFRFKENKYLSIIITGIYERTLPYFIIILQVAWTQKIPFLPYIFIIVYLLWSFIWETRNYLNGQLKDRLIDEKSGIKLLIEQKGFSKILHYKKIFLNIELALFCLWSILSIKINHSLSTMFLFVAIIPLFHWIIQNKKTEFSQSKEFFVDYIYNYVLIAAITTLYMILNKGVWLLVGIIILFLFKGNNTLKSIDIICMRLYFISSSIVNYSIYYFRKYILRWTEEKSRGLKNRLIFLHIPKTAGTTFTNILIKQFPEENIFSIKVINDTYLNTEDFISLPKNEREKIYLLYGRVNFGLHQYMSGVPKYITFLRDPRERVVSFYSSIKQNLNLELGKLINRNKWTLYDFVKNVNIKELNNGQLKLISGIEDDDEVIFEKALENIKIYFAFVGITEYFEKSLARLKKMYGWQINNYKNYKVNSNKIKWGEIDRKTQQLIEEKNREDIIFYELMKKRFLDGDKP